MERNAAHRCTLLKPTSFSRQGQLKFTGCREGILKEHFIKVSNTIKQNLIGMLALNLEILLHHGRHRLVVDFLCLLGNRLFSHASHS